MITANLRKMLHRKAPELVANTLTATNAGCFLVADKSDIVPLHNTMYYVAGPSLIYEYNADNDAWMTLPASGIAGTYAAGACGEFRGISAPAGVLTTTASAAGTTSTIVTTLALARDLKDCMIRVVAGTGVGYVGFISHNTKGTSANTIYLRTPHSVAFDATTQFQLFAGSLWFMNAGTTAVGFSVYDRATNTWTARSVTNLPTAWGTGGVLLSTGSCASNDSYQVDSGTVSSVTSTTLVDSTKSWAVNGYTQYYVSITGGTGAGQRRFILSNTATTLTLESAWTVNPTASSTYVIEQYGFGQFLATAATTTTVTTSGTWNGNFANYQLRIVAGTGAGQIRTISSNTTGANPVVTVSAAFTVTPDTTSVFRIEGNDDYMYLLGNNAVTMYRFSVSAGSWTVLAPTTARGGAPGAGLTANWIDGVKHSTWNDSQQQYTHITNISLRRQNGRYIYSFRGGAGFILDIYDIAANTWFTPLSATTSYGNAGLETFTTGSSAVDLDGKIYIVKEATGRVFVFDVHENSLEPFTVLPVPQGTAVAGQLLTLGTVVEGSTRLTYLFALSHTSSIFTRMLII